MKATGFQDSSNNLKTNSTMLQLHNIQSQFSKLHGQEPMELWYTNILDCGFVDKKVLIYVGLS